MCREAYKKKALATERKSKVKVPVEKVGVFYYPYTRGKGLGEELKARINGYEFYREDESTALAA